MVSEMLFNSNVKFWQPGYSCHLLTIELISERGYEVKFLLLLFRLGSSGGVGEQNDHLNAVLFKLAKATKTPGCPGRGSRSELTPKCL